MPVRDDSSPAILTAQDLRSGVVVYWKGDGWTPRIADAAVSRDPDAARALGAQAIAANAGNDVVDAFVFPAADAAGGLQPTHFRERWRAAGPSIAAGPR